MKGKLKIIVPILLTALVIVLALPKSQPQEVSIPKNAAVNFAVPYQTWTLGPEGSIVNTQTAYTPVRRVYLNERALDKPSFSVPQDIACDFERGLVYVADTGNSRAVVLDSGSGEFIAQFGQGVLKEPAGICVSGGKIYVADRGAKLISVFSSQDYAHLADFAKPDNPLVGANTPFVPQKISVDPRGNMYIVSEGCVNGLMQLNPEGDFIGYVGANTTAVSFWDGIKNMFFSREQRQGFLKAPRSPSNVAINSRGLLYTVTNSAPDASVKKLNTLGNVIMSPSYNMPETVAVYIDERDNIFSVTSEGVIVIYDSLGSLLFAFGGKDITSERLGLLDTPVALTLTDGGSLWVLDRKYNMIVEYAPTEFAGLVYNAIDYYKDGLYLEGEDLWKEVLRQSSNFIVSYRALAQASMKRGEYPVALKQFKLAEDKNGYSEAYWQIRNAWLQKYLGLLILFAAALVAIVIAYKELKKRRNKLILPIVSFSSKLTSVTLIRQLLHLRRFGKSPRDAVYEVKSRNSAGAGSATILYLWFVIIQILSVLITGYLFTNATVYNTNAMRLILLSTLPLFLFFICNYFVSTVTDGEGKLKHCYTVTIYALMPYLVYSVPLFILSNFLTFNEAVIYNFLMAAVYAVSGIFMFLSISELHDFTFWQTVKNIVLTLLTCVMAVLAVIILRLLLGQLFDYILQVLREVFA